MLVKELSKNQLRELKERYLIEKQGNVSYGELVNIDKVITDKEVFEEYQNVNFVEEDFFSK